ncbi:MAG: hypothetical protein ACFHWX_13095 [Bacteroidota bacterium]
MITYNKEDLRNLLLMEELSKLHSTESKISSFEKRYGKSFSEFKDQIESKEVFEEYDDFIEWKALIDLKISLERKIAEIRSGQFQIS